MNFDTRQQRRHCKQKQPMCTLSRAPQSSPRRRPQRPTVLTTRPSALPLWLLAACCALFRLLPLLPHTRADAHCSEQT